VFVADMRRSDAATYTGTGPLAHVVNFSIHVSSLRVGFQDEIIGAANRICPSPVAATTTDTTTLTGTNTTGTCIAQRRERPATLVDAGKRPPARAGMPLKTSGSGFVTVRNEGTTRPPPPYAWNKKKEHVPVQDVETHGKQGMECGGSKEGGGNVTVKRRRGGPVSSGRGGGGGATWLCFNNLVRLLLVVVCGLGGVEGFAKLPDGYGGYSNSTGNEGTLRRAVSDWIAAGGASSSTVVATYGPIEDWDVSEVTNMKYVFWGWGLASTFGSFNADLSKWNTGAVTTMFKSKCTLSLPPLLCICNL
jgi:surface protein